MASIPFPIETYELLQNAGAAELFSGVQRDVMDDGTPKLRSTQTTGYFEIPIGFRPYDKATASALIAYLLLFATQEFTLPYLEYTVEGYFWSDPESEIQNGQWWVTTSFYGKIVS